MIRETTNNRFTQVSFHLFAKTESVISEEVEEIAKLKHTIEE